MEGWELAMVILKPNMSLPMREELRKYMNEGWEPFAVLAYPRHRELYLKRRVGE